VIVPGAVGVVTMTWAQLSILPRLQPTGSVPPQEPCVVVTAPRVTRADRSSVSVTPLALLASSVVPDHEGIGDRLASGHGVGRIGHRKDKAGKACRGWRWCQRWRWRWWWRWRQRWPTVVVTVIVIIVIIIVVVIAGWLQHHGDADQVDTTRLHARLHGRAHTMYHKESANRRPNRLSLWG
jgi:hypothetical protein